VAHPTAGIIQIIEMEEKKYFFNNEKTSSQSASKLPTIKGVKYITNFSPNKKLIAYISADPVYK
jgi:hypothetical protein